MMRLPVASLILAVLLGQGNVAHAQPAPFDMSPERPAAPEPVPSLPRPSRVEPQPAPPQPARPQNAPDAGPSPRGSSSDAREPDVAPERQPTPPLHPDHTRTTDAAPAAQAPGRRRYIIPSKSLALSGEYSRNAWSVYLTAGEADAGRLVAFAYQNAIVVAPEASNVSLTINNRQIGRERINAPAGAKSVRWTIPAGLLRPGKNDFELVASHRHRTDCDIRSTYDLWTEIDGSGSFIEFAPSLKPGNSAAEAIQTLGPDPEGRTEFQMIVPSIGPLEELEPLLRLSQGLAVMSGMPNPQFAYQQQMPKQNGDPGKLTVAIGTAAELSRVLPSLPPGAESGPVSALVPAPDGAGHLVIITGPTWSDVGGAIETFIRPVLRTPGVRRESMSTDRWTGRNAPFMFGGETLTFAQLGVPTTEFAGRRFRTGFDIAVPSDFYAGAYGEAVLLLDAAYSASVAGGSHIDIYVNGSVASTVPVTEEGGRILRQAPIRVTMRHLRAGINRIELEAVLLSSADETCAPGSNASDDARFALFDTSALYVPTYARIGQTPNLTALAGTGSPYSRQQEPTAFFMDRIDADTLTAAANFLGKMAQVSGAPIGLAPVSAANAVGGRNALFIGSAGQLPPTVLTQLNLDPDLAAGWKPAGEEPQQSAGSSAATLDAWNERLEGRYFSQKVSSFRAWLRAKLDLTEGALRFLPGSEGVYRPTEEDDLLLAQGPGLNGGIWTVLTAPNAQELKLATAELTRQPLWQQVDGRIFSYSRETDEVTVQEARSLSFLPTIDPSFGNYRLIAANWLSSNLLSYALAIVLASCLLGITTATLLRWVGRRK